jgi:hypothetical protein
MEPSYGTTIIDNDATTDVSSETFMGKLLIGVGAIFIIAGAGIAFTMFKKKL